MKRTMLFVIVLAILAASGALAEGVTLRTVSCFAGEDVAAVAYAELLRAYEEQTGNVVEDTSGTSDESWKARVLSDFAVGNEPDVLFFFACSADSAPILRKMVPIAEINDAYPELALNESLGRKITVTKNKNKEGGVLQIEFYSDEELKELSNLLHKEQEND